jgi:hypothetical protein
MKRKHVRLHHKPLLGALLLTAMLAACGENDDLQAGQPSTGAGKQYVSLTFTMPTEEESSRASNPTGGENGDGHEMGQDYENTITDAVAFFFQNNGAGVNGDVNTPVRYMYFNEFNQYEDGDGNGIDRTYTSKPVPTDLYGAYNVLVVANPGKDDWWTSTTTLTLGTVRDKILTQAWTKTGDDYTNFLMSSAKDAIIEITDANNTEATAANTTVDVERMAARVDYKKDASYTCTDPNYTGATVEITGATIINRLTAGSYLLKRVAEDVNGKTPDYLGKETSNNDKATNYVLDPWTAQKTQANLEGTPFTVDGQNVAASDLYDPQTYIPTRSDNPEDWADYCKEGVPATADGYLRVGYALENTTDRLSTSLNYNTGIVFKAQFHPQGVDDYYVGNTFFTYNGTIYPSLTNMVGQLNTQADFATYAKDEIAKLTTWDGLKGFANSLNDPTGYGDYLTGYADEHSSDVFTPTANELTWTYYLYNKLGVVEDAEKGPEINLNGVETRAKLYESSEELLRTYYNGQCYYIWWLRHSNDGDDETNGVMEYAVVRNNIYKVNVESIYSLGGDIPDNEQLKAMVYVNKWTMLNPEVLPM